MIITGDLTIKKIEEILQKFRTSELPHLQKLENYYLGKHLILSRQMTDSTKPNNRIVINYPAYIVDSFASYLCGSPITYSGSEEIKEILEYNDTADLDLELDSDANIFGYAIEQVYLDSAANVRQARISPKECILLYDNSIEKNLLAAIRFYPIDENSCIVEVYDSNYKTTYSCSNSYSNLSLIDEEPHYFNDVPFVEYINNEYRTSSFETVIPLIDGLEKLSSDCVNDFEAFCDCYMVLKNVVAESEDIQQMKENRVLLLDSDSEATYLTKEVNVSQIESLKKDFVENIHKISCVPNMSDSNFAANASGVAIRFKLLSFENATAKKERKFKKGLQRRLELINNILSITGNAYLNTIITFTRNLPVNEVEIAQEINQLRGLVSTRTLISQLPFVEDADEEIKLLEEETAANSSLYAFGSDIDE